jgi:hypothetical protein
VILALLAGAFIAGCGTLTPTDFSGGGVPIGGSRLFGRVVPAADPAKSLSNVTVKVRSIPNSGASIDQQVVTASDGTFGFANVLPGASSGTVQVTAVPSDAAFQPQQVTLGVASGHTEQLIVTLPPASFDPTTAKSVALAVASPAIPTGGSTQVQAVLRDANGQPLGLMPTLEFDGSFGTLGPDGTITVPPNVLTGTGTIIALWDSLPPQSQQLHVDKNASQQPPSPPILPTGQGKHAE